jgi:deoxyinosine 3'endonuclease (endonuclease V)
VNDDFDSGIEFVCGVDVSYQQEIAHCSAAIVKKNTLETVEVVKSKSIAKFPYVPGFFMLRESSPIRHALRLLTNPFQLLLIDGMGCFISGYEAGHAISAQSQINPPLELQKVCYVEVSNRMVLLNITKRSLVTP